MKIILDFSNLENKTKKNTINFFENFSKEINIQSNFLSMFEVKTLLNLRLISKIFKNIIEIYMDSIVLKKINDFEKKKVIFKFF